MAESKWIVNTTDDTFEADVFARSELGIVVVDFWADWCAPCRMIGPVLEKLAIDGDGRFTLVKALTDDNQEAANRFEVRGIPAVFAVLNREIIDQFEGAMPPPALESWLASLESAQALENATQLAETDPSAAENALRDLAERSPDNLKASIALGELLLKQNRDDECQALIERLESRGFLEPEAEKLKAALALKGKATIDVDDARAAANAKPDDFGLRFALAEALVGQQQYAEAFDLCLSLVEQDRHNSGEQARALMVEVFQTLPSASELVTEYRRQLSMLLY